MAKQQRRIVTQAWIDRATAVLDARPRGARAALARKIGCDKAMITQLLRGDYYSSEHVEAISKDLGLSLPPLDAMTPEAAELMSLASKLDDDQLRDLIRIADRLAAKK